MLKGTGPWFWRMAALFTILQLLDVASTYVGLHMPAVYEANRTMGDIVKVPLASLALKMGIVVLATAGLAWVRNRPTLPVWVFLNGLMALVVANNVRIIMSSVP